MLIGHGFVLLARSKWIGGRAARYHTHFIMEGTDLKDALLFAYSTAFRRIVRLL